MSLRLDERYGRRNARRRRLVAAAGLAVLGGGHLGAVAVGGSVLLVGVGQAVPAGEPGSTGFVAGLAALLGGVLGAASGACAGVLAWAALAVGGPRCRSVRAGIGAAVGGGGSTTALILAAQLLPGAPAVVPAAIGLLAAALDAVVAVVVTRAVARSG